MEKIRFDLVDNHALGKTLYANAVVIYTDEGSYRVPIAEIEQVEFVEYVKPDQPVVKKKSKKED